MLGAARRTARAMYDVLMAWPPPTSFPGRSGRALHVFVTRYLDLVSLEPVNRSASARKAQWRATCSPRAERLTHRDVSVDEAEGKIDSTSAAGLLGHTVDPMLLRCTAHDQDAAGSQWKLRQLARGSLTKFKCSRCTKA